MKKSIVLAAMVLASALLAGCGHPNDITDEIAAVTLEASQA